jgi:hypothetical protein
MVEMIRERQAVGDNAERHDLFSSLMRANDQDLDLETLSENEIISMLLISHIDLVPTNVTGNIYIFLVAGHEVCTSFRNSFDSEINRQSG